MAAVKKKKKTPEMDAALQTAALIGSQDSESARRLVDEGGLQLLERLAQVEDPEVRREVAEGAWRVAQEGGKGVRRALLRAWRGRLLDWARLPDPALCPPLARLLAELASLAASGADPEETDALLDLLEPLRALLEQQHCPQQPLAAPLATALKHMSCPRALPTRSRPAFRFASLEGC